MSHIGTHIPGSCGCGFDPGYLDEETRGEEFSLIPPEIKGVEAYNCVKSNSVLEILKNKNFSNRNVFNDGLLIESDADEELLICISFSSYAKIKSIMIIGDSDETTPSSVSAYVNQTIDFDSAQNTKPTQSWSLTDANLDGNQELPTTFNKFANCSSLTLYIPGNIGGDEITKIRYIGLRGVCGSKIKTNIVRTKYEIKPQISDHNVSDLLAATHKFI